MRLLRIFAENLTTKIMTKVLRSFNDLKLRLQQMRPKKRVAVVCPSDIHTMQVVDRCLQMDLARFTLILDRPSDWADRLAASDDPGVAVIYTDSPDNAARIAVAEVRESHCDVVMKGAINTDNLLHAVLNKEHGLLEEGRVLTHITAASIPSYHKLLFFSDAAVVPMPDLHQLDAMISYDVTLLHKLGITEPRVALIHFTEKVNPKFPNTLFYEQLKQTAADGHYGSVIIGGPMDVKSACDIHSAQIKHIQSDINGDADLLIFPSLVSANTFYKSISLFGKATMAGIVCGANAPIVIPSRADSAESKFYSLALACMSQT